MQPSVIHLAFVMRVNILKPNSTRSNNTSLGGTEKIQKLLVNICYPEKLESFRTRNIRIKMNIE